MADLADLADLADPIRQDSAGRMADPIDRQQAALARQLPKTIEQLRWPFDRPSQHKPRPQPEQRRVGGLP